MLARVIDDPSHKVAELLLRRQVAVPERANHVVQIGREVLARRGALRGATPWRQAIGSAVESGTPLLGICVGMQWLFEGSEEAPDVPGLGVLPGRCRLLQGDADRRLKIPHVGWNALELPRTSRLLAGLASGAYVYFTHSFAAPVTPDCVASTTHTDSFAAAVERDSVFGVQFHPEKSGDAGLQILRNYLELCG